MFGLGPAYLFILQYRLPLGLVRVGWQPWLSTMGTNLAIVGKDPSFALPCAVPFGLNARMQEQTGASPVALRRTGRVNRAGRAGFMRDLVVRVRTMIGNGRATAK